MFIGEIEEVGVIEPISMPESLPAEQPETPVEEPVPAR
jgi:hypothetical protein